MKNTKRVHWAFDPYSDVSQTWTRSIEALKALSKNEPIEIIPTYFVGHDLIHWVSDITPAQVEGLKPTVEKAMKSRLEEFKSSELNFKDPKVVISYGLGGRKDAQVAADFFSDDDSDLVVLNTHARKKIKRWLIGSFAESLLLQCEVPMLFVSPNTDPIRSLDKVFYPTDFSNQGFEVFPEVLKSLDTSKKIILYSKVVSPVTVFAQNGTHALGGGWVSLDQYVSDIAADRRHHSEKWKQAAISMGFEVQTEIDEVAGVFIDDLLDSSEKNSPDLIAVASFSSKTEAFFIGSTARELVRNSKFPVLVRHFKK